MGLTFNGKNGNINDSKRAVAARQNGSLSRGPKTPEGKARSARNATRHGLLAKRIVVHGLESEADFEELLEGLKSYYYPYGWPEEMAVEEIASYEWRLRRAGAAERGEIERLGPFPPQDMSREEWEGELSSLESERELLDAALNEVQEHGYLNSGLIIAIGSHWDDDNWANHLKTHNNIELIKNGKLDPSEDVDEHARTCSESLEQLLQGASDAWRFKDFFLKENYGPYRPSYLPERTVHDHILRYEITLRKARDRAIDTLYKLQRARRHGLVPQFFIPDNRDLIMEENGDVII